MPFEQTPSGMILAAGMGKRLEPLTLFRAKPAIPFLNRPLIHHAVDLLRRSGVTDMVINLHHLPQTIIDLLTSLREGESSPGFTFSHEETLLGTAGGIGQARHFFSGDPLVVCNGKIYFEEDLSEAVRFHRDTRSTVTLVLIPHSPGTPFTPVFMGSDGTIAGFGKRSGSEVSNRAYVFTGVHVLSREVLGLIPEGCSDTVRDLYPGLMRDGYPVRGFVSRAYWCECSSPRRYLEKSLEVLARRGLENMTGGPHVKAHCRGVVADPSAGAHESSRLENCVLWDAVKVGPRSSLHNVILSTGVELPSETHLRDVVVTPLPEELTSGAREWIHRDHLIRPL